MKKLVAEAFGTAVLVLFGVGSAILAGEQVGQLGISLAFGLAIVAMAYGIGPVSGCHVNPAVSLGAFVAGRMSLTDMLSYWAAQVVGAVIGAGVLFLIVSQGGGFDAGAGFGSNGYAANSPGGYPLVSGLVFEVVATFIFVAVILGATQAGAPAAMAGLAIGLTLAVIHIVGIQVTGVSVNPARSIGPALFAGGAWIGQLWLFILAPLVGAALAGLAFRSGVLAAEKE
jgi:aquaporin Z